MALGEKRYTRIPPESTGDRLYMIHTAEIEYKTFNAVAGGSTDHSWKIGSRYDIAGFPGGDVHVHGVYDKGDGTGLLAVHYNKQAKYEGNTPTANAEISLDGTAIAEVNAFYDVYIPANNIMGYDNPEYGWDIDRFGSGQVTFAEGAPEVTEFGELRTSNKTLLAQYMFTKSRLPDEFSNALIGAGTVNFESGFQAVRLDVGDTLNDQATHTSNVYHPYIPGTTNLLLMGTRIGDTGVAGLVRNWGLFDATDGFFFQLNGTSLNVVHRYTFSGSTTNSVIPQANWNKDKLDGTGGSGFNLDVSKNNIYWIDFQHIGGGRIRWGVYYEGERVVCHEMDMGNGAGSGSFLHNALGNPNRPICWATKCISGTPGYTGTRSMYAYGAGVWAEGLGNTNIMEEGDVRAYDDTFTVDETTPYTQGAYYLTSLRPLEQIPDEQANPQENHSLYLPKFLTIDAYDENGNDVRGELRIFSQCILRGSAFTGIEYTTLEGDKYAQHVGHGPEIFKKPIKGPTDLDFTKLFTTIQNGSLKVTAETTTSVRKQDLTRVLGTDDPFGNGSSVVTLKVGINPVYLSKAIHFFADKNLVEIAGLSVVGPDALNGNSYYLSLQNTTEAQIYSTLNALNDDRKVRILNISGLTGGTIDTGDTLTISGAGTCTVHSVSGSQIRVEGRTNVALDVGLTAASGSTDGGATTFTVDSVILAEGTNDDNFDYYLPYDRYTLLGAVSGSGWATSDEGDGTTNIGTIEGTPPTQPTWTFMWRPVVQPTGASNNNIRFNLHWKERIQ